MIFFNKSDMINVIILYIIEKPIILRVDLKRKRLWLATVKEI